MPDSSSAPAADATTAGTADATPKPGTADATPKPATADATPKGATDDASPKADGPPPVVKHENMKGWQTHTEGNVNHTKNAISGVRKILEQLEKKEIAGAPPVNARDKALSDAAVVDELDARVIEVKEAVKRIGDTFLALQYEFRVKYGQLKVCEERLDLRSKRPEEEIFKDHLHEALENEKKVLMDARKELQDHAKEAMKSQTGLEAVCGYLVKDMAHKRTPATQGMKKSVSLPMLDGTQKSATSPKGKDKFKITNNLEGLTIKEDPVLKAMKAPELVKCAHEREARSDEICQKGTEAISRLSKKSAEAHEKVVVSMARRCAEVGDLKKLTYDHLQEANATVADAQRVLHRLFRQYKVTLDTAKLEGKPPPQRDAKLDAAVQLLEELTLSREKLEDDYRCKTASLILEQQCKNLVAARVDARKPEQRKKLLKNRSPLGLTAELSLATLSPASKDTTQALDMLGTAFASGTLADALSAPPASGAGGPDKAAAAGPTADKAPAAAPAGGATPAAADKAPLAPAAAA